MGGYVVMSILDQAPARVSGLILISTRETADSESARRSRGESIEKVLMSGPSSLIESMLPKMLTSEGMKNPSLSSTVRSIMESASSAGITAALRAMAARPDRSALLSSAVRPTLLVFGEQDTIITVEDQQRMRLLMPEATLSVVPRAAHLPNLEQHEVFNAAMERFLKLNVADSLQGQSE